MQSAQPSQSTAPVTADDRGAGTPGAGSTGPTASRSDRSPKDMAVSLLVLLIPIALLFGFYRVVLDGDEPAVVDPAPTVAQARPAGAFPVAVPDGLAEDWRPIRASFRQTDGGAYLRIGYVTPEGGGVQLVESDVPADRLLPAELTADAQPRGTVEVGGRTWHRYTARPGETAVVLLEPRRTVIVVGSASESELWHLVRKLTG